MLWTIQLVLVTKLEIKEKVKCKYRVCFAIYKEKDTSLIIGIYPKLAENLVEKALQANLLTKLANCQEFKRKTKVFIQDKVNSRFDFSSIFYGS